MRALKLRLLLVAMALCALGPWGGSIGEARSFGRLGGEQANNYGDDDDHTVAVIPSPNEQQQDIQRVGAVAIEPTREQHQVAAPSELATPIYVSPFLRPERAINGGGGGGGAAFDASSESSQAAPNYAPQPAPAARDLKASASYGHHHHHHQAGYGGHHDDTSGWLDMGAWTGGKGSFGWYADYPVGGKSHHHYGHGRK